MIVTARDYQKPGSEVCSFDAELMITGLAGSEVSLFLQNYAQWLVGPKTTQDLKEFKYEKKAHTQSPSPVTTLHHSLEQTLQQNPELQSWVRYPLLLTFFCEIYAPRFWKSRAYCNSSILHKPLSTKPSWKQC